MTETTTETDAEKLVGCSLSLILIPFTSAYHAVVGAFVVSTLWGWFAVPFFGARPLSLPLAAGLLLIAAWLRLDMTRPKDRTWGELLGDAWFRVTLVAILGAFVLAEGWIIHRLWLS